MYLQAPARAEYIRRKKISDMIRINDFTKFYSIIDDLQKTNTTVKLFGKKQETFCGMHAGLERPTNNFLNITIVALTSIGTIYCNQNIKLSDNDLIENATKLFSNLNVSECEISLNKDTGVISFK